MSTPFAGYAFAASTPFGVLPGSAALRSLAERGVDIINVKDFGAQGDGIADDGPAILSAITYSQTLNGPPKNVGGALFYLPAGTYFIANPPLALDGNLGGAGRNFAFMGAGRDATIIKGNTNGILVINGFVGQQSNLSDFTIWNTSTGNKACAYASFGFGNMPYIERVHFIGFFGYVAISSEFNMTISECIFDPPIGIYGSGTIGRADSLTPGPLPGSVGIFFQQANFISNVVRNFDVGLGVRGVPKVIAGNHISRCNTGIFFGLAPDPVEFPPDAPQSAGVTGTNTYANFIDRCRIGMYNLNSLMNLTAGNVVQGFEGVPDPAPISTINWAANVATVTTPAAHNLPFGVITFISITAAGSGYVVPATYGSVPLIGGSGTGATADIHINSAGQVGSISMISPGSHYVVGDNLSVSNMSLAGSGSGFVLPVTAVDGTGAIVGTGAISPGAGYGVGVIYRSVPLTGGTGSGATADVNVNSSGQVASIFMISIGLHYTVGDVLSASNANLGGTGSGLGLTVGATDDTSILQLWNLNPASWTPDGTGSQDVLATRKSPTTFSYTLTAGSSPPAFSSGQWNYALLWGISNLSVKNCVWASNYMDNLIPYYSGFDFDNFGNITTSLNQCFCMQQTCGWLTPGDRGNGGLGSANQWTFVQCGGTGTLTAGFGRIAPTPFLTMASLGTGVGGPGESEFSVVDAQTQSSFAGSIAGGGGTNHYKIRNTGAGWTRIG